MLDPEPSELFKNTDRDLNMGTKILQELDIKREHKRQCRYESKKSICSHRCSIGVQIDLILEDNEKKKT